MCAGKFNLAGLLQINNELDNFRSQKAHIFLLLPDDSFA
jgi:hypothetical protein